MAYWRTVPGEGPSPSTGDTSARWQEVVRFSLQAFCSPAEPLVNTPVKSATCFGSQMFAYECLGY